MSKLTDLLKRRDAVIAELNDTPERKLAAIEAEIAKAEADEKARQEAARQKRIAQGIAKRDAAEAPVAAALQALADALATLGEIEDNLRPDLGWDARSPRVPERLREAVRRGLAWYRQWHPEALGLPPIESETLTPAEASKRRLRDLERGYRELRKSAPLLPDEHSKAWSAAIAREREHLAALEGRGTEPAPESQSAEATEAFMRSQLGYMADGRSPLGE